MKRFAKTIAAVALAGNGQLAALERDRQIVREGTTAIFARQLVQDRIGQPVALVEHIAHRIAHRDSRIATAEIVSGEAVRGEIRRLARLRRARPVPSIGKP